MNFLLDTCLISELVKKAPESRVLAWLDRQEETSLYLSVLTFGELHKGIGKLPVSPRRDKLQRWVDNDLAERFAGRILPLDLTVSCTWGDLQGMAERGGTRLPVMDSLLAATALVHGLTVATRNTVDLVRCQAMVFNPWEDQESG